VAIVLVVAIGAAWFVSPRPTDPAALVMARLRAAGGSFVTLDAIAPRMREAVVAAEDERFWRHHGVDVIGLARAMMYDVSHLCLRQGASTITEQLGKDLYLNGDDHSPVRKVEDVVVALRLESHLSKDQILELYLNEVYFGSGAVGVDQASERYFGISPSHLSLAEASLLAGMIEAPTSDDPYSHDPAARDRQAQVLTAMVRDGYTTESEAQRAVARRLLMASGDLLPIDRDATVQPGAQISSRIALAGIVLAMVGAAGFVLERKKQRVAWPVTSMIVCAAGLVLVARALRAD
jgi:membrane peptidoglycan carboxypeptidase